MLRMVLSERSTRDTHYVLNPETGTDGDRRLWRLLVIMHIFRDRLCEIMRMRIVTNVVGEPSLAS